MNYEIRGRFVRLTVKCAGGKKRTCWARRISKPGARIILHRVVTGVNVEDTNEIMASTSADIVKELPAVYNLKYDELSVDKT